MEENKVTAEEKPKKKDRPQNKNLLSFAKQRDSMSPEEWRKLQQDRSRRGHEKRREKYALAKLIQAAFKTKVDEAVTSEIIKLVKMPKDSNGKMKADIAIIGRQIQEALQGDKDARDWLFKHGYPTEYEAYKTGATQVQVSSAPDADGSEEEINIHLIRGQKPTEMYAGEYEE